MNKTLIQKGAFLLLFGGFFIYFFGLNPVRSNAKDDIEIMDITEDYEKAILGAGCFWCVEAVFSELRGVLSVKPGYTGGRTPNPTYKDICTGTTGHAEVCEIIFDNQIISFEELLEVFWVSHDPTTKNRQGNDVGTQYRSSIFFTSPIQQSQAEHSKSIVNKSGLWTKEIVTEISPLGKFHLAEDYHNDYYKNNPNQSYCTYVISPKVEKVRKLFKEKLK